MNTQSGTPSLGKAEDNNKIIIMNLFIQHSHIESKHPFSVEAYIFNISRCFQPIHERLYNWQETRAPRETNARARQRAIPVRTDGNRW